MYSKKEFINDAFVGSETIINHISDIFYPVSGSTIISQICYEYSKWCCIYGIIQKSMTANAWNIIGTIDSRYVAPMYLRFPVIDATNNIAVYMVIENDTRNISIYTTKSGAANITINMCYLQP